MSEKEKSRPYLVMEFLEGQTLERRMQQERPLAEAEALRIMSQVASAVDYLHQQGIVHRDLKPQNVMLCHDGSLRIMDFGIAKAAASRRLTFGGFSPTMGTPDYMAPEQVKGQRGDERTDIYSLGATLYALLTGQAPFREGDAGGILQKVRTGDFVPPRRINADIPAPLEAICLYHHRGAAISVLAGGTGAELPQRCQEILNRALAHPRDAI